MTPSDPRPPEPPGGKGRERTTFRPGECIGPFLITDVLGEGGMGVVYSGNHRETGVRAAIKTVTAAHANKVFQIRREIETLARLRHPGVVQILDHGVSGGRPWYAMTLLEGRTLDEVIRQFWSIPGPGPSPSQIPTNPAPERTQTLDETEISDSAVLPEDTGAVHSYEPIPYRRQAANGHLGEALGLMQRLCETLAYVHGEGVIHRDLKPSNIFVTADNVPVLVDFGLVANVGVATGREVFDDTLIAGSAKYMAPEQISGGLLDPRADVYALGCLFYELLTGRAPFEGRLSKVIDGHLHSTPRPVSDLATGLREDLAAAIMRMLNRNPRDRTGYTRDLALVMSRSGAKAAPWPTPVPRSRSYLCRPPMVGRQEELRDIEHAVQRLDLRKGGLILVSGESGVGKTRLALEVASRATSRGSKVVMGGCAPVLRAAAAPDEKDEGVPLQAPPLHPLQPLLRAIVDRCAEGGLGESEHVFGDRGPVLAAYEPSILELPGQAGRPPVPPLPLAPARERLYRSLMETLSAHTSGIPVLLLLDDLQWADELTLGFLRFLAGGPMSSLPLLLLGNYRIEESTAGLGALAETKGVVKVALTSLSPEHVGDMVGGMLALKEPPRGFVSFLARKSEGNPFFVTEYLRMAVAEQVIVRTTTGEWTFAETTDPTEVVCESLPLPRSLREVIDRRLAILTPAARRAVDYATLMGRELQTGILQHALGADDLAISAILIELWDRRVFSPVENADAFRFAHDKLREVPFAALGTAQRSSIHQDIALAIESYGDRQKLAASLGHHWSGAGEPARAIPYLHEAADRAQSLFALADAVELYRAALNNIARLRETDPEATVAQEAPLCEKLADALALTGAHEQARHQFERAVAALGADRQVDAARLHRKIGKTLDTLHDHEHALESYARSEELLDTEPVQDSAWRSEWIHVRLNRIWVYYWQARIAEMDELIALMEPVVETHGLPLQRSSYYQAIVTRNYRQQRYVISDQTIQYARQSLAFAIAANARVDAAFARFILGFGLLFSGDLESAEAELFEGLQETRRLGDVTSQIRCLAYLVVACRRAGKVAECRRFAEETMRLASAVKMHDYLGVAQAGLGWVALKEDNAEEARRLCQAALESWGQPTYAYPFQWTGLVTLIAVQKSRATVRQLIELAEKLLDSRQMKLPEPVEKALESAIAAYHDEDAEGAREALLLTVCEAERVGLI